MKWVDDTHAIGVFASSIAARDGLALKHPLLKVRSIQDATRATKVKIKKSSGKKQSIIILFDHVNNHQLVFLIAEFLQPYKVRPQTVASVARNMVAGALGLQSKVSREVRDDERRKLREARGNQ